MADSTKGSGVCGVCGGRKVIPEEVCRGCGLPASKEIEGRISYCGEERCLVLLTNERYVHSGHSVNFDTLPMRRALMPWERRNGRDIILGKDGNWDYDGWE